MEIDLHSSMIWGNELLLLIYPTTMCPTEGTRYEDNISP